MAHKSDRTGNRRLGTDFFRREAAEVAPALIGCILCRQVEGKLLRARIVETEAYIGPHDLACHASKGRTARTAVMFGPAGRAYVYFIYGMHEMLNVVTGPAGGGGGQAVLIRAAEPLDGWEASLSGPAKLTRAFGITRALNGVELTTEALYFEARPRGSRMPRIATSPRIGVDYAGMWAAEHLRFFDAASRAVSGRRPR